MSLQATLLHSLNLEHHFVHQARLISLTKCGRQHPQLCQFCLVWIFTMSSIGRGGALLHLIPWERDVTYATIVHSYVRFIMKRFKHCTVVFDGYSPDPSTKDVVHARRCKGKSSPEIRFTPDMSIQVKIRFSSKKTTNKK